MAFEMNRFIAIALLLLIGLFNLDATSYASRHARSNLKRETVSTQEMDINDIPKHL
jgi:hypothetical protein